MVAETGVDVEYGCGARVLLRLASQLCGWVGVAWGAWVVLR